MKKNENKWKLPEGSNWVFWKPKHYLKWVSEKWNNQPGLNTSKIEILLLFSFLPFLFLTLGLNWFWSLAIGLAACGMGVLVDKHYRGASYWPWDGYSRAVLLALFWACAARFAWLNYQLGKELILWIGSWF